MGCWNGTCVLTNLPIFHGDEVYTFILQQSSYNNGYVGHHCYSNTYYNLIPLFFEGKYNDYGAVEDCHGDFLPDLIEGIKSRLFEFELGENQYHDIAVKKDKFDLDLLFEASHVRRLAVRGDSPKQEYQHLAHVMIRKEVLEFLLKNYKIKTWKSTHSFDKDFEKNYQKFKKAVGAFFPEDENDEDLVKKALNAMRWLELKNLGYDIINLDCLAHGQHNGYQHIVDAPVIVQKYVKDDEKLRKLFWQFSVCSWLNMYHMQGRKQWIVPSGRGSQGSETYAQQMTGKLVKEGSKAIKAMFKKWEDE